MESNREGRRVNNSIVAGGGAGRRKVATKEKAYSNVCVDCSKPGKSRRM